MFVEINKLELWSSRVNVIILRFHKRLLARQRFLLDDKSPDLKDSLKQLLTAPQYESFQRQPGFKQLVLACIEWRHKWAHQQIVTVNGHISLLKDFDRLAHRLKFNNISFEIQMIFYGRDVWCDHPQTHKPAQIIAKNIIWPKFAALIAAFLAGALFAIFRLDDSDTANSI
ncbi:hypothetical protein BKA69DRAFT_1036316 [Paraphysoderma sedebokerense]|nr:hypothetical protein BKA69DRAFT_1036316 [Paraphysoderma sedebokerense]